MNINQTTIEAIISAITIVVSVVTSAFVSGVRWGSVKTDISYIKRDLEMIKSMFVLTIKSTEAMKGEK